MNQREFEYDAAFSFLAQDEHLATQMNDLIQDRLKTFLYSERQREIAGTDGEKTFNSVFSSQARVVVVLYRDGWGETAWTRIEETAIRNRGFTDGYDFALCIPLDTPPKIPEWLPKNRLWVDLDRLGVAGAVAVIEARVNDAGGKMRPETVVEKAARVRRHNAFDEERVRFLCSEDGVGHAREAFRQLCSDVEGICQEISDPSGRIAYDGHRDGEDYYVVYTGSLTLLVHWHCTYDNTLEDSSLIAAICEDPPAKRRMQYHELVRVEETEYEFDLVPGGAKGWRSKSGDRRFFTTRDLAEHWLGLLVECVPKHTTRTNGDL